MTKAFYIALLLFITVLIADILSFKSGPTDASVYKLLESTEAKFINLSAKYLDNQFLHYLERDSLNNSDLNFIRNTEEELKQSGISIHIKKNDGYLFWTTHELSFPKCRSFKKADYKIQICVEAFDAKGRLQEKIYNEYGIKHQLLLRRKTIQSDKSWNDYFIEARNAYRSSRFNNLFILSYLICLFALIWQAFKISRWWLYLTLAIGRLTIAINHHWQDRFSNSDFWIKLFDQFNYGSLFLCLDLFICWCVLIEISKRMGNEKFEAHKFVLLISNSVLFSLLICSHIRLVQHIALSESFNITINDISSINIPEVSIFISLILALSGIFIYSISYLQQAKKILSRKKLYFLFLMLLVLVSAEVHFLNMNIKPMYLILFLGCYLILIDLFIDIKQKSITWVIWWGIFFSTYLSALFFNYDIYKQISQRRDYLKSIYQDTNQKDIDQIIQSSILDSISENIASLMVLPEEAEYHKDDIQSFIVNKYKNLNLTFDVIKPNGEIIFNTFPGISQCNTLQNGYLFDPYKNTLWLKRSETDNLLIYAGIIIHADNLDKYPLVVIKNAEVFQFGYNSDSDEISFLKNMDTDVQSKNSRIYIRYKYDENEIAFSVKRFESLIKPIALFSFLFTCIIGLFILLGILSKYLKIFPPGWPLHLSQFESLNSKIQAALIFVILLSFIFIAVVTSSFLKTFINSKNNQFLAEKTETIAKDIKTKTRLAQTGFEAYTIADNYKSTLQKVHNVKLQFHNFSLSPELGNYFAYSYFKKQRNSKSFSRIQESGRYISYFPFRFKDNILGYIEISEASPTIENFNVYDFLGSIFNVYVFLFLIASVMAIFIASSITKPLSILNQKLSALKLGKRNELISWDREDEIGTLIANYNNMVNQLDNSVKLLAKTERDNAWREMAKQVAHEIKNPLTPMKMYIQHLEKAIKQHPEKAPEISKKISSTLLEQVESLTQIADSFSNFAELPQSSNEKIELNSVVELVHNLFRKRDDMVIKLSEPMDAIHVYADKNQLIRILNNLVKNAIESIPKSKMGEIELKLFTKENKAIIQVEDNGSGIPKDMYEKVFQPKFTTKDSGSGLGLAIALNMIESMNGRLYFESEENVGTSFFIELDIIRQNFEQNDKRITLD